MSNDTFSFDLPVDVVKSEGEDKEHPEMRIGGYASTDDDDRQGDVIVQKGLDYSDFVNYGYFNFDHHPDQVLGWPDKGKCHVDSKGFYVEGTLLDGVPLARSMWETALSLKRQHAPRRLGFSVEGKVLQRDEIGKIAKAKIYNVALTYNPVNPEATWDALVKSFTSDEAAVDKALEAGNTDESRSPLIPESLESALHTLSYTIGDDERARKALDMLRQALYGNDKLSKSELVLYYQLTKGLSRKQSIGLVNKLQAL